MHYTPCAFGIVVMISLKLPCGSFWCKPVTVQVALFYRITQQRHQQMGLELRILKVYLLCDRGNSRATSPLYLTLPPLPSPGLFDCQLGLFECH